MLSDRDACELSAQGWANPCLWWCLEGVSEEGQKEVTLDHWFEPGLNFSHCLCCFSVGGGLSGAQRDVVTLSSWKDQGVLLMVGFRGLLKTTSWQSVLPSFQQPLQTSSLEINISPFQRLKRSDKGLNITTRAGGWLQVIEQRWAVWFWANHLTSLSVSFLFSTGMVILPAVRAVKEHSRRYLALSALGIPAKN